MTIQSPGPVKACIFDMDGLLINSEDLITESINSVLAKYSRPPLPWSIKAKVQGRTAAQSNEIFQEWAKLPISRDEYATQLGAMHRQIFPQTEFLPGVETLLATLAANGVEMALATSSTREKFDLKTAHLRRVFDPVFPVETRILGDDARLVRHKPAGDCYLLALECVNERRKRERQNLIGTKSCLVFEDALEGVAAGMAARMRVVWCPHVGLVDELRDGEDGDDVRKRMGEVLGLGDGSVVKGMSYDEFARCVDQATEGRVRLLMSLENFPYAEYGLKIEVKTT